MPPFPPMAPAIFRWVRNATYGYGWGPGGFDGKHIRFHTGDNSGYRSANAHFPETNSMHWVLTNEYNGDFREVVLHLFESIG